MPWYDCTDCKNGRVYISPANVRKGSLPLCRTCATKEIEMTCQHCGDKFMTKYRNAIYCCKEHKREAQRIREKRIPSMSIPKNKILSGYLDFDKITMCGAGGTFGDNRLPNAQLGF